MTTPISATRIVRFWLPLAGTWWMMALEGPLLTALIARLADPKPNLAAFGVAFAVAIIVESPVIMLMSASTALVKGADSCRALWRFTLSLNVLVSAVMVVVVLPPVWGVVAGTLLGLPADVATLTHQALIILLPWPAAIGDRRFHQGILIAAGLTRRVAYGTALRVAAMGTVAVLLFWRGVPGVQLGAAALAAGVVVEAIASRWMVRAEMRRLRQTPDPDSAPTQGQIRAFYLPLAMTSILGMAVQPVVTFFMGQSRAALESLAVLPVINGLTFLFRAVGISFQEAAIAVLGESPRNFRPVRQVAIGLGLASGGGMLAMVWTPGIELWLSHVSGLSAELTAFAIWPCRIIAFIPLVSVTTALQRAVLVHGRDTGPLGWATGIELLALALTLLITTVGLGWIGAVAAMTALLASRSVGAAFLWPPCRRVVRGLPRPGTMET